MSYATSNFARFDDDVKALKFRPISADYSFQFKDNLDGKETPQTRKPNTRIKRHLGSSLTSKVLSRVFSEDYEKVSKKILDPRGETLRIWNKIFLAACLVSLFVDPLFFYLPSIKEDTCIDIGGPLKVTLTIVRSIADVFYIVQIYFKFVTAYVAPSSRVFGRGELVIESSKIARRYIKGDLWIDVVAALPLPQMLIWIIIPSLGGSAIMNIKNVLRFIIVLQYIPRLYLIFPLTSQITEATGVIAQRAWSGAAYNLMLYMLASHCIGACWYLLTIERQEACWRSVCVNEDQNCVDHFFDCRRINEPARDSWYQTTNVTDLCASDSDFFSFGIFEEALEEGAPSALFLHKYFYCLRFGLKSLSSSGQELDTSAYIGENIFAIVVSIVGLLLFALLIGNMQRFLQSTMVRVEEWRVRRNDTEQWMRHRQLPLELRQSVRRYDQYKWLATRGVDEESILKGLPLDLRRDIKRHICYDLVRRVPLFNQMDEPMLDAICERLNPALYTQGTCLVREGDPVKEMLFVIRGNIDSYTTNGGRTGFFNSCRLGPSDFCGEELLTWALDPRPSFILPSSTRTVKAISEVEAFALMAEDLKFVASQFRRMHSKQLQHKFRFYSHQWRTWAACFIQAAWRKYKRRKNARILTAFESFASVDYDSGFNLLRVHSRTDMVSPDLGYGEFVEKMSASRRLRGSSSSGGGSLRKPAEPDFSVNEE